MRGSEQGKTRPVLIISRGDVNELLPVVNVLPITSRKAGRRIYPNEALLQGDRFGLRGESIVLCFQIRTLDKTRLMSEYGLMDDTNVQEEILEALSFQLSLI